MGLTQNLPVYCARDSVTYGTCHRQDALTSVAYGVWKLNKCMSHFQLHILFHTVVSCVECKIVGAREMRDLSKHQHTENFTNYSIIYKT